MAEPTIVYRLTVLLGCKRIYEPDWPLEARLNWLCEAVEALVLAELERRAIADGVVDMDGFAESAFKAGVEAMERNKPDRVKQ